MKQRMAVLLCLVVGRRSCVTTHTGWPCSHQPQYSNNPSFCQRCPEPGLPGHQCSGGTGKMSPSSMTCRQRCLWQKLAGRQGPSLYLSSHTAVSPTAPTWHAGAACHAEMGIRTCRTGVAWGCPFYLSLSVC